MSRNEDDQSDGRRGWLLGLLMLAGLILMAGTFVWAVISIDPLIQDFIPGNEPPTATIVETEP
jgi:MYXO-CTERM domain-containing protein